MFLMWTLLACGLLTEKQTALHVTNVDVVSLWFAYRTTKTAAEETVAANLESS